MSIILAQFVAKTGNLWVNEVWPSDRLGMMGNATRKDSGRETRLLEIVLRLPRYWDRFWKFSVIFGFRLGLRARKIGVLCATSF